MTLPSEWEKIIVRCDEGIRLQVKITPGSSRTRALGPHGDCLKIAVSAPPEKGKANQALIEYLSKITEVPRQKISVVSGQTSPRKILILTGASSDKVFIALQRELEE